MAALRSLGPGLRAAQGARAGGSRGGACGGAAGLEGSRRVGAEALGVVKPDGAPEVVSVTGGRRAGAAAGALAGRENVCARRRGAQRRRGRVGAGRGGGARHLVGGLAPILGRRPMWAEGCCRGGAGSSDGLCVPREPEARPQLKASRTGSAGGVRRLDGRGSLSPEGRWRPGA